MFSNKVKSEISEKIQKILQETKHPELPEGEIPFLLHVDGESHDAWANIRNSRDRSVPAPSILVRNMSLVNTAVKTYLER